MKRAAEDEGDGDEDTEFEFHPHKKLKQSLDPFEEAAAAQQSPSPPLSEDDDYDDPDLPHPPATSSAAPYQSPPQNPTKQPAEIPHKSAPPLALAKSKEDDDDEEENLGVELGKCQPVDPDRMQAILSKFSPEQMRRYECYRRSGFQKANMRRVLQSVAGCTVSLPMTIVMSGIAKMFVGELVETGRLVMTERKDSGPLRPCHVREAYRRLKLKGKVPQRVHSRLFH